MRSSTAQALPAVRLVAAAAVAVAGDLGTCTGTTEAKKLLS